MNQIPLLVVALAGMAVAQILPYTGPTYMGPPNSHGIYGPYGTYGPTGRYGQIVTGPYVTYSPTGGYGGSVTGPYRAVGNYGPFGNYGQGGVNSAIYHIANSFFSRIQRRIENSHIPLPDANAILDSVANNFKICENEYIAVPVIQTYKTCLQTYVNKAMEDVQILEAANQPYNFNGRFGYPYAQVQPLPTVVPSRPVPSNSIQRKPNSEEELSSEMKV